MKYYPDVRNGCYYQRTSQDCKDEVNIFCSTSRARELFYRSLERWLSAFDSSVSSPGTGVEHSLAEKSVLFSGSQGNHKSPAKPFPVPAGSPQVCFLSLWGQGNTCASLSPRNTWKYLEIAIGKRSHRYRCEVDPYPRSCSSILHLCDLERELG